MNFPNTPSKNLKKWGSEQQFMQVLMFCMALVYCIAAALLDGPIMQPSVYGDMVTSVNAEWWSWPILIASMVYLLGIWINGNWLWSPALRLIGALFHMGTLTLFALMAYGVQPLNPFVVVTCILSVAHFGAVLLNAGDLYRAFQRWRR